MEKKPLTNNEIDFILNHCKEHSAPAMAKELHRDIQKIYRFLDEKGLKPYNGNKFGRKREFTHLGYFNEDSQTNWLI